MEPNEIAPPTDRDTICAISTPAGVGGIAVARLSGPQAIEIADTIWEGTPLSHAKSHTAHLGNIIDPKAEPGEPPLDQAVATVYRAPRSFTADDVVEFSIHGSRYIQQRLINLLTEQGARLAQPGEFTRRAFASGKIDLTQAEAIADVIAADSRAAHRLAATQMRGGVSQLLRHLREKLVDLTALLELELDFSEEEVEFADRQRLIDIATQIMAEITRLHDTFATGQAIKEGIPVAIVGPTNAGKSSLLNALLGDDRAIVSDIHGTTRDTIEEIIHLGNYTFRLIDTAGLRDTDNTIEQIGIKRSRQTIDRATIVIYVADATAPLDPDIIRQISGAPHPIIAVNKIDLPLPHPAIADADGSDAISHIAISARYGQGLDNLKQQLIKIADATHNQQGEGVMITNLRHAEALAAASASISRVLDGLQLNLPGDLIAQDLRQTIHDLSAITGDISSPEILSTIFSRFCIGK